MKIIKIREGQTFFDIAIKYYGDVEGMAFLLKDNAFLPLDESISFGKKYNIREEVKNQTIVNEFLNYSPVSK